MQEKERLAQKLKRNRAAILTDREVELMVGEAERVWYQSFPQIAGFESRGTTSLRFEDSFRWGSLGAHCRQAREAMGFDLKEAGVNARLPRYRVEAIESGHFSNFQPDHALRYFEFLGIEAWARRWCKLNAELAERVGIGPVRSQVSRKHRRKEAGNLTTRWTRRTPASRGLRGKPRATGRAGQRAR